MKKILALLVLFFPFMLNANTDEISFNLAAHQELEENEGQVPLNAFELNLGTVETKSISLLIPENDNYIFADDTSNINFSSLENQSVSFELLNGNKELRINSQELITGDLIIYGVLVRIYELTTDGSKIGLDYDSDGEIDLVSSNLISIDDNSDNEDNMRPLSVRNIENDLSLNSNGTYDLLLTWDRSPDLDLLGTLVKVYKNNSYGNISEEFITVNEKSSFTFNGMDLSKDIYSFEIFSKDSYYLNLDPVILNFDKNSISKIEKPVTKDDNFCVQVISYGIDKETGKCETFSTPCSIPVDYQIVESCEIIEEDTLLSYYNGIFSNKNKSQFNKIVSLIDKIVNKKLITIDEIYKKNVIIEVRNTIVLDLEGYDVANNRLDRKKALNNLVSNILELKKLIK